MLVKMDSEKPLDKPQLATENEQQWQHLAPIAIVYFGLSTIRRLLGNIVYLLPALVLTYSNIIEHPGIWIPVIMALFGLLTLFAILNFRVYRYRLTANNIEIRSGIFKKKYLNLPFARIQNVKIEQPVYYRLTGFACLLLDTAGSSTQEAKVVALPLEFAEQLKLQILNQEQEQTFSEQNEADELCPERPSPQDSEQVLNRRKLSDLIIHGITSNRIWIFLGGLAPFYNSISENIVIWLDRLGLDFTQLFSLETHSMWQVGLYAVSLAALMMLLLVTISIIGSIVGFYGFTLSKIDDRYIRRSGLFTRHEVSMRLSRLQMIVRKQDWLDMLLKRINLKFEQSNDNGKNTSGSAHNNKIVVPSITADEAHNLISDAYPDNELNNIIFAPISKRFIFRYIAYYLFPLWLAINIATFEHKNVLLPVSLLLAFFLLCSMIVLRWKRWGFAIDENFVYIRKGLLGVDYYCFPTYKVQQTQFKQSVLMRRRQLASVKLILASGSVLIPLIDQQVAYSMVDECLYQVESSRASWM
jgi:putative membrane protein